MDTITELSVIDWLFLGLVGILAGVAVLIDRGQAEGRRRLVLGVLFGSCAAMIAIFFMVEDRSSYFFGDIFEDEESTQRRKAARLADAREGKRPPRDPAGGGDGEGKSGAQRPEAETEAEPQPNQLAQDGAGAGSKGGQPSKPGQMPADAPAGAFRDCPICPQMVPIRPGTFSMGSAPGDPGHAPYEEPRRLVTVAKGFALGRYEIKAFEFDAFVKESGYAPSRACVIAGVLTPRRSYRTPGFLQDGRHPVVCVSHGDAVAYTQWLSRKTGQRYRLPSESEWELAARAGAAEAYPTGRTITAKLAQYNAAPPAPKGTLPVGSFAPNAYGLQDMAGNVWELVADCWQADVKRAAVTGAAIELAKCSHRVIKGGAWYSEAVYLRSAARWSQPAGAAGNGVGFRVARDRS